LSKTLEIIQDLISRGYQYSDIAVLTRKRNHGVLIANHLTEHQIPIISSETLLIKNSEHVQLLIAMLKLLRNPKDIESKAHVLYWIALQQWEPQHRHDVIKNGIRNEYGWL